MGVYGMSMKKTDFEKASEHKKLNRAQELFVFVRENKKWWLGPIIVAILLLGLLVFLGGTAAAPFIYTLF